MTPAITAVPVLTVAQMRAADTLLQQRGMPGRLLMEHAAAAVVDAALSRWPQARSAVIVCGTGNNGGDGFAVARLLTARGVAATVWLAGPAAKLTGDALANYELLAACNVPVHLLAGDDFPADDLAAAGFVVDALCGTGFSGRLTGLPERLALAMNACGRPVVSIDLPSGVSGDGASVRGPAVQATLTLALGAPQPALLLHPAAAQAGEVVVAPLGMPLPLDDDEVRPHLAWLTGPGTPALPARTLTGHKQSHGRVFIIAGSPGMCGAAQFACRGALATGAGFVRLAAPASLLPVFAAALPEVVGCALPEGPHGLTKDAVDVLLKQAEQADCVLIGPGFGRTPAASQTITTFFRYWRGPLVIDADALFALSEDANLFAAHSGEVLLTPHYGELARLQRTTPLQIAEDPVAAARLAAQQTRATVLLKGSRMTVTVPDGETLICTTGTPALAAAGTGDLLAGLAAGCRARGGSFTEAAARAAWFLGLAGQRAAARAGETLVTAPAVAAELPFVLRDALAG